MPDGQRADFEVRTSNFKLRNQAPLDDARGVVSDAERRGEALRIRE